jgi:hypothetical protein
VYADAQDGPGAVGGGGGFWVFGVGVGLWSFLGVLRIRVYEFNSKILGLLRNRGSNVHEKTRMTRMTSMKSAEFVLPLLPSCTHMVSNPCCHSQENSGRSSLGVLHDRIYLTSACSSSVYV